MGDRLERVNELHVSNLTHHEIMLLLRNAGPLVTLELKYDLKSAFFCEPKQTSWQKCAEISLENDYEASTALADASLFNTHKNSSIMFSSFFGLYGITIRGGAYGPDSTKNRPITITSIRTGGPAHRFKFFSY